MVVQSEQFMGDTAKAIVMTRSGDIGLNEACQILDSHSRARINDRGGVGGGIGRK